MSCMGWLHVISPLLTFYYIYLSVFPHLIIRLYPPPNPTHTRLQRVRVLTPGVLLL